MKNLKKINLSKLTIFNKKIIIYGIIAIFAIAIIIYALLTNMGSKKEVSEKERLENYLKKIATNFYENDYYSQVSDLYDDMPSFLSNFTSEGISMSIQVLIDNGGLTEEEANKNMKNKDNNELCDFTNTKAIIYPVEPYDKDSYNISIQLDCSLKSTTEN